MRTILGGVVKTFGTHIDSPTVPVYHGKRGTPLLLYGLHDFHSDTRYLKDSNYRKARPIKLQLLRRFIVNRGKCLMVLENHRKFLIMFAISRPEHNIFCFFYFCAVTVKPTYLYEQSKLIVYRYRRRIDRVMTP